MGPDHDQHEVGCGQRLSQAVDEIISAFELVNVKHDLNTGQTILQRLIQSPSVARVRSAVADGNRCHENARTKLNLFPTVN